MADERGIARFGECATLVRDTISPVDCGNANYIGLEHIGEGSLLLIGQGIASDVTSAKLRFQRGDILFGKLRPYFRKVIRAPFDGVCSTDIWVVRARDEIDQGYLFCWMASHEFVDSATKGSDGTKMPRARWEQVSQLTARVPSLSEQRAIGHVVGILNDKIDLNRRMNEKLGAIARTLFKNWFVDFDPVRAKTEGRNSGLPTTIDALFPDSFQESELGQIPQGWKVRKLSDLCTTQYGYTASANINSIGPRLLRVTDINKQDWIDWSSVPRCEIPDDVLPSYTLKQGDIVVARMADPGKSAIIDDESAVFASYLVRLRTDSIALNHYVYGFLKSSLYAEYAAGAMSGSVQANMNARVIVAATVVVPPAPLVERFYRISYSIRQRIAANVRESNTLRELRDTLLPKLLSGELRVKDVAVDKSKRNVEDGK